MAKRKFTKVANQTDEEATESANKMVDVIINKHFPDEAGDDWPMKQAYIALGMAMYSATILNIGTTPMEGLEKTKVEKLFLDKGLINKNERVAVACAFGFTKDKTSYAHWGSGKRVRNEWDDKFTEK